MYSQLGETDFEMLNIVDSDDKVMDGGRKFSRDLRDYPRFSSQMSGFPKHPMGSANHPMVALPSFQHPMANMSGLFDSVSNLWDSATQAVSTAVQQAVPQAEEAAKEALAKVAGGVASDVLSKPAVQQAITETAKTQATQALAVKIQEAAAATSNFFQKYQKPILYGGIGVAALGIAYIVFGKKILKRR